MLVLVTQSCLTLWDPTDCSLPGSSIHGVLQGRILEWDAMPFSSGSSQPRDRTLVSCTVGRFFTIWAWWESYITPKHVECELSSSVPGAHCPWRASSKRPLDLASVIMGLSGQGICEAITNPVPPHPVWLLLVVKEAGEGPCKVLTLFLSFSFRCSYFALGLPRWHEW